MRHGFSGGLPRGFGGKLGDGSFLFPWMHLIDLAFVLLIIFIGYMLFKTYKRQSSINSAIEILNIKFAKGEISEEEYINKKNLIKSKKINKA
ncbi:MAG: hypothetical protein JG776_1419 [Caloramator sp.]|jgi:putative membrane protein|uniref:SHOCT domain-containing protein n=1 Tax=Caloramator sp. TaxID=1871330 RepID=UPI001DDBA01A|nr:SHOCT domain-containing protein [Caloramator sp.]MBZ4663704.1 hypothetical protein [Caloramator sp.]